MSGFLDDLDALLISSAYVLFILGFAELMRRRGVERTVTRKIVHVGVGTWIIPYFLWFDHRLWAVVPALCFVLVNALSLRFNLIRSVEGEERNLGTVLYPLSVALALFVFWPESWRAVGASAILVMAWGDAAASLVGRRWGRHSYRVFGHPRSLEGSAAMGAFGTIGILAAFAVLGPVPDGGILAAALIAAGVATLLEAVSLWGFDNVLVPAGTAITLVLLRGGLWN